MSQQKEKKRRVSRKDMTLARWTWKEMKRNKTAYIMCAPFFLLFFVFTVLPVALSIFFSFTEFNMLEPPKWVVQNKGTQLPFCKCTDYHSSQDCIKEFSSLLI